MGTEWKYHKAVIKNQQFYKECRQIIESQISRRPERVRNELDRYQRNKSVHRSELCGKPIRNVIIPSEQNREQSNDSNDENITDNDSDDDNSNHPVLVATSITHFLSFKCDSVNVSMLMSIFFGF